MAATSLAKRRFAWALFAFCNVASGWLVTNVAHWTSYWLLGLGTSVGLIPMLYREPASTGLRLWVPWAGGMLLFVISIALLL